MVVYALLLSFPNVTIVVLRAGEHRTVMRAGCCGGAGQIPAPTLDKSCLCLKAKCQCKG